MSSTRYASVLGLGFGDCGKGLFVDALTRRWQAHTVVRFSGGAQAGHNVVTAPGSGAQSRHHTFAQFGSGTLASPARTVLLHPMVVHPTALIIEANVLSNLGVHDALSRLLIDGRCRVTTPYHQAAGRLREMARGSDAHGTCGVGVGETVREGLKCPEHALCYEDLAHCRSSAMDKLQLIRKALLGEMEPLRSGFQATSSDDWAALNDESLAVRWLNVARTLARQCPPASVDEIASILNRPGTVLFEGAQGILLDEWRGFHPHTTWSSISTAALETAAECLSLSAPIQHYGVMRTYLTRHGPGPLPTYDSALDDLLPEPHNYAAGWQGHFRRGHPDAVLLKYALDAVGSLSGLFVSHLDVFQRGVPLKWCERYVNHDEPVVSLDCLPVGAIGDLTHQSELTDLVSKVSPVYRTSGAIDGEQTFLRYLGEVTSVPVVMRSYGNTSQHVNAYLPNPDNCPAVS